jgi:hypothetical protein
MKNRNARRVETLEQGLSILLRELDIAKRRAGEVAPDAVEKIFTPKSARYVAEVRKALNLEDDSSVLLSSARL